MVATIDSGATSTAISLTRQQAEGLLYEVLEEPVDKNIYIADDKPLRIAMIGKMKVPTTGGYELIPEEGVEPRDWKKVPCQVDLPSSRTLVIDGLGEDVILLSVKGMKRDGIKTFLNDDNSIQREDCLLMERDGRLFVVPFTNANAYQIPLGKTQREEASVALSKRYQPDQAASADDRATDAAEDTTRVTSKRSPNVPHHFHCALGHVGDARMRDSNITIDGVNVSSLEHDPATCVGCRLGNTGRHITKHRKWKSVQPLGPPSQKYDHFGQEVNSDICTGFEPSFPHRFTSMLNFKDRWGTEGFLYFLRAGNSAEICSSLDHFVESNYSRLVDGKIGRWVTDNGRAFLSSETNELAEVLSNDRGFSIPFDSNSLAVPERHWGVLERMMRSMHAGAADPSNTTDHGAPSCLWTWSAQQANLLLHYLPTRALSPPMSPYQFTTGDAAPVDLSWARAMFCDVTVSVPDKDVNGKTGMRSADGCHFGFDRRRGCHFVYVEALQRLTSCTVAEWRDNSFVMCKRISADTPVDYFEAFDLPFSNATSQMIKHRHIVRHRQERVSALSDNGRSLKILVLYHRERDKSLMESLRAMGHEVRSIDLSNSASQDLLSKKVQYSVLDSAQQYHFVFMCPPCTSSNIAMEPPLRTYPDHTRGIDGLTGRRLALVTTGNAHFDFCAEVMHRCNTLDIPWAVESCAGRRYKDSAEWPKFSKNGFIWDYPPIERVMRDTTAKYTVCAQCQWGAEYQKYTGFLTSGGPASKSFTNMFASGVCVCSSHKVQLQGYDTDGVAKTAKAAEYPPLFASAIAHAVVDSCSLSDQEGEEENSKNSSWSEQIALLNRDEFEKELARTAHEIPKPNAPVTFGLSHKELNDLHAAAYRERLELEPDVEIWMSDSEGAWMSDERERAFRVSETGSELANLKTVEELKRSKFWPLVKTAMEEEINGKLLNGSWECVTRPKGNQTILKSRWVVAVKLNDDNSIKQVKMRFVACGYSQKEGKDFDSVFAATMPNVSFRLLVSWINDEDLDTDHIDATKAFTQADVDKPIYVESPEGFTVDNLKPSQSAYVLLIFKALEGIKQGAALWFKLCRGAVLKLGGKSSLNEVNLYIHEKLGLRIGIFADDIIVGFKSSVLAGYKRWKKEFTSIIRCSQADTISPVLKFTGVQIERNRQQRTIKIHQERYIEQMGELLKDEIKRQEIPHGTSREQRLAFDKILEEKDSPSIDRIKLLKLLGKIVWPSSMTRLDVSMETSKLCSAVPDPRQCHYDAALVVAGYLWATKDLGITYGGKLKIPMGLSEWPPGFHESSGLYTAHDSSWGTCAHPLGGYVIMYCNGAVDWSAKMIKIVPDSSCEAETALASRAAKATCFVRALLRFHGRPVKAATPTLGDNKAMYILVTQEGASARTRYYERATMLIKRAVLMLLLVPHLISTHCMVADLFTKALDKGAFIKFRDVMMNNHTPLREALSTAVCGLHGEAGRLAKRLMRQL